MAGDAGIADIRQPHLVQTASSAAGRFAFVEDEREEAVEENLPEVVDRQVRGLRAADDLPAAAHHGHGVRRRRIRREQGLLRLPTCLREQAILDGIESASARQLRLDVLGKGEVHVVAAEQQMVADRLAEEAELAVLLVRLNQTDVGGAAADVDDQTEIAGPDAGGVLDGMTCEPAIKCGLWLFEEREVSKAGLASGIDGLRLRAMSSGTTKTGTVRTTFCFCIGAVGWLAFQASTRCFRYRVDASTGEIRCTSGGAVQGKSGAERSTPL